MNKSFNKGGSGGFNKGGSGGFNKGGSGGFNKGGSKFGGNKFGGVGKPRTVVVKHRHEGIFVLKGKAEEKLLTLNINPGESVYAEKRVSVEQEGEKLEYREWNGFRSKLAAGVFNGLDNIYIKPGAKVLYLGAANGTTVSHVADIVGPTGIVYAVEFSKRSGRDLINMSKKRPNIVPIVEDARKPNKYRMFIGGMVDCIFCDVAQPDQARIIAYNAEHFLKIGGGFVFSIKANCVDSTADPEVVFKQQVAELKKSGFKAKEQVTLEPFERDHAMTTGVYNPKFVTEDEN